MERGERVEQPGDGAGGDHADHQPSPDQGRHLLDRLPGGRGGGQRRPGVRQRRTPGRGQGGSAGGAVEQGGAEVVLELADLGTDPGLADVDAVGGPGEVRLLGHRDEVRELPQFHKLGF